MIQKTQKPSHTHNQEKPLLFFAGMKHSGKSTLGKMSAEILGYSFYDNDDLILAKLHSQYGRTFSIRDFYTNKGKSAFMELEFSSLEEMLTVQASACHRNPDSGSKKDPAGTIYALGGGACENHKLITFIKQCGRLIYLAREEHILFERIIARGIPPFLSADDPEGSFHELYKKRVALYEQYADITIHLAADWSIEQSVNHITTILTNTEGVYSCTETALENM